jgi:hypothetical protein
MTVGRSVVLMIVTTAMALGVPVPASAQQTSGIAGVVRDASGAVLPGVQVETTSPALTEKVRTAAVTPSGSGLLVGRLGQISGQLTF